jgi:hypothetical protein
MTYALRVARDPTASALPARIAWRIAPEALFDSFSPQPLTSILSMPSGCAAVSGGRLAIPDPLRAASWCHGSSGGNFRPGIDDGGTRSAGARALEMTDTRRQEIRPAGEGC